jgi:hypothetical protein
MVHRVHGPPTGAGAGAAVGGLQFGHDCLDRALGEGDRGADVTDPGFGLASDLHEHVPVHQATASGCSCGWWPVRRCSES